MTPCDRHDEIFLTLKNHEERLGVLERAGAVGNEQIKMVFKILNEIKESVDDLNRRQRETENKPAQNWDNLVRTAIAVLTTAAITYFISKR